MGTKSSKKERFAVVLSIVWLILVFAITLGNFSTGGYGGPNWRVFNIFILFGILPLVLGWGIRWIFIDNAPQMGKPTSKKVQQASDEEWCEMGYEYIKKGELNAAEECYQEALKINPENPWALLNLGYIYSQSGESRKKAISYYQQVIDLAPTNTVGASTDPHFEGKSLVDSAKASLEALNGSLYRMRK